MKTKLVQLMSAAIVLSAIIAMMLKHIGLIDYYAIFKPLTTILIIATSVIIYKNTKSKYSFFIVVALVFALIGDVFLIGDDYFLYGLSAFALAHIFFTLAFSRVSGFLWNIPILLFLLIFGASYFYFLYEDLQSMAIPVSVYMLLIIIMNWQAIALAAKHRSNTFYILAGGSLLFSFSDALIACEHFISPFSYSSLLILATYWTAILIFTLAGLGVANQYK